MKLITLTRGKKAKVSNCDFVFLMQWKWHFLKRKKGGGYAARRDHKYGTVYMHMAVASRKGFFSEVDHKNQNKLDNRRRNLRPATRSQNKGNCGLPTSNRSGFKGVSPHKASGKWMAYIRVNYRQEYLGLFPFTNTGKHAAARAYNKAARKHFGKYACLNRL